MTDKNHINLDFLNTLGREFCAALEGVVPDEDLSPQDCYSVLAPLAPTGLTPQKLSELTLDELTALATAFNRYFECNEIELVHVQRAIERTLWHWPPT